MTADAEALCDWLDTGLRGDYFFRQAHLRGLLAKDHVAVWAVLVDGWTVGVCVIYRDTTLQNLYLDPPARSLGIGRALLQLFKPALVRAKSNMRAGDPTPWYQQQGYTGVGVDPHRPHIRVMVREDQHADVERQPTQAAAAGLFQSPPPMPTGPGGKPKRQISEATRERLKALGRKQKIEAARRLLAEVDGVPTAATSSLGGGAPAPDAGAGAGAGGDRPPAPTIVAARSVSVTPADGAWALPAQATTPNGHVS